MRSARQGDFILRTREIELAVAATRDTPERALRFGSLVGLELRELVPDSPLEARRVLRGEGGEAIVLAVHSVRAELCEGAPELVIVEQPSSRAVMLETRIRAERTLRGVRLETRLRSDGTAFRGRVGDRVLWPGRATFAPGAGDVEEPSSAQAPWIARESGPVTYGLAFPNAHSTVEFSFDHVGPSGVVAWSKPLAVEAGQTAVYTRFLVLAQGDLAKAAGLLWPLAGVGVGMLEGRLDPPPSWARLEARDQAGRLVLRAEADAAGYFGLPLPPGGYRIGLQSPGGTDERSVRLEAPGQRLAVELIAPKPGHLHFTTTDDSGAALAARWMMFGVAPTPDPVVDGPAIAEHNAVLSVSGFGDIELPEGTYLLRASHGPEFSVHEQQVAITAGKGASARATLRREVEAGAWLACDFHLHASPSFDSEVSLEQRVVSLLAEGVNFAVATDHDVITDYAPAFEGLKSAADFRSAPGVEITTRTWGHFNAFPYPRPDAPVHADLTPARIFEELRQSAQGVIVQVNHPRLWDIGYFKLAGLTTSTGAALREGFSLDFDTIEVFNGFDLNQPGRVQSNLSDWFELLNLGRRYTAVGSSDSHRLTKQWAGYPRTYVPRGRAGESVTADAVARALKQGRAMVTNGPFLRVRVNGAEMGELVGVPQGRALVEIEVSAPSWMTVDRIELIVNGRLETERRAERARKADARGPLRWRETLNLDLEQDTWILVVARGGEALESLLPGAGAPALAFTNPIYVDVDGDGRFTPLGAPSLSSEAREE